MKIQGILTKLNNSNLFREDSPLDIPLDKQLIILNGFSEPKNDLDRSYYQYCCQVALMGRIKYILLNLAALPLLYYFYIKKNDTIKDYKEANDGEEIDCFFPDGKPIKILPSELKNNNIKIINNKKEYLDSFGKAFFRKIVSKHPYSWLFLLKCLIKIRIYGFVINSCKIKRIIVCNEYSFTSSILTLYCEQRGIEHINVMHGEKLFYIRDTFFRYTKCFVWNKWYINLFLKLRAYENQFIVSIPESLKFTYVNVKKNCDFKYYLGGEDKKTLVTIYKNLLLLSKLGSVKVRPHPRYTDVAWIKANFSQISIEDTNVSIENSILETEYVISLYSTVLTQAYYNKINIIIDDISNNSQFQRLKERGFCVFGYKFELLSDYIKQNKR